MDSRIVGKRQRLDNLEAKAKMEPVSSDDELKACIAQLLCVLSSGLIEEAVRVILTDFANRQSSPRVASYVSSRLADFQNPNFEKILMLLGSFDQNWRIHFDAWPSTEMRDAINSIVTNRNQIAHGKQVGVSLVVFGRYYLQLKLFIDELDRLIAR